MASTSFALGTTIPVDWLNDVNSVVYSLFGASASLGAVGTLMRSNGSKLVATTSTFADAYAVSTILFASATNVITGLATANSAGLLTNGSGVPSWVAYTGTGAPVLAVAPTITGHPTIEGVTSTGATGTGKFVFDTSPTIATPTLSAPVLSGTITGTYTIGGTPTFPAGIPGTLTAGTTNTAAATITASHQYTQTHSLGVVPTLIVAYLLNVTTDQGFAANDRVYIATSNAGNGTTQGVTVAANATNTYISTSTSIAIIPLAGGTAATIDLTKWSIVVVPYKLN